MPEKDDILDIGSKTDRVNSLKNSYNSETKAIDMEKAAKLLKGMIADMDTLYASGEKAAKIMDASAEKVRDAVEEAKYGVENLKRSRDNTKQAFADAIKNENDPKVRDKLRTQQRKQELEDNKKFNEAQAKAMKDSFSNIANGIFTFNPREIGDAFKALKGNLKEVSDYYGGAGKAAAVGLVKGLDKAVTGLSNFAKGLNNTISSIANYKTAWDTRLFGSGKGHTSIADLVKNNLAISPYVKQQTVMEKLSTAINEGIAYNVEQRAFLASISDSIATTFDAFDTTLKDLVRVQQADSTAYRLGMEASLNEYLNRMFENTQYLTDVSDTVTANLYQATSLLDASKAIGYEYQVQKWLGALYSVGMSSGAVSSISQALGQLLSGDISGTDSGAGKLLVMAAANSGLDYAKLLTDGINDSDVNLLLGAMVDYLKQIANDNKVVQSQMAGIFGLQTADIEAAQNLTGFINSIYEMNRDYSSSSAMNKLGGMMSTVGSRMSLAGMLENLSKNFQYTLAEGIAANPALYGILTIGNLLEDTVGGINIPTVSVFGNSVDLNATVADLLRSTALGGSILAGLGPMFAGLGDIASGKGLINAYNNFARTSSSAVSIGGRGLGLNANPNDSSLLAMNYKGNTAGDDYMSSNEALINDTKKEAQVSAEDTNEHKTTDDLYALNTQIYDLIHDVIESTKSVNVKLTNWNDMPNRDGQTSPGGIY